MPALQHMMEVPRGLIDRQELLVVSTLNLLCRAQLPGELGEGLPNVLHQHLENGTHGVG